MDGIEARKFLTRRAALGLLGGAAASVVLVGCKGGSSGDSSGSASDGGSTGSGSCAGVVPEETNGPFPADGTNGPNVLTNSLAYRTDIRSDFDGTDVQPGTPLTLTMTLLDRECAPLDGYYVYIWHCNAGGHYSAYSGGSNGGNYSSNTFLRGIAQTDADGQVTFTTIFPGRYSGRATHIHVEVYATSSPSHSEVVATTQLAFPDSLVDGTSSPYNDTSLYPSSAANDTQNGEDGIFADGVDEELLTVSGNNSDGYTATIAITVDV